MDFKVLAGLLIPFAGTALGSACVFFMKDQLSDKVQKARSYQCRSVLKVIAKARLF